MKPLVLQVDVSNARIKSRWLPSSGGAKGTESEKKLEGLTKLIEIHMPCSTYLMATWEGVVSSLWGCAIHFAGWNVSFWGHTT